ncbi:MAG: hypothetical protein IT379_39545 [Deltaproteobacteria bacterium]|nr:hypothetical protein [Deltaproteobacteria bacterium]
MRFPEWVDSQGHGVMTRIQRDTGVGYTTLMRARRGELIGEYATAKRISEATGGAVSIAELCEPAEAVEQRAAS